MQEEPLTYEEEEVIEAAIDRELEREHYCSEVFK